MKAKSLVLSLLASATLSLFASFSEASQPIVYARVEFTAEQTSDTRGVYVHWVQTKDGGGSLNVLRLRHRSVHSLNEAVLSVDTQDLADASGQRSPLLKVEAGDVCLVPITQYSRSGRLELTAGFEGWDCTVSPTP